MPPLALKLEPISVEDYLNGERMSEIKHEYVQGEVFAMAGASLRHHLITGNVYALLWNQLRGQPCFPLTGDMLVKTGKNNYRYPDVQVVCNDDSSADDYVREQPILIVEVLSRSTRRKDKTEKRAEYLSMPSVQEYVLIEQNFAEITVLRRSQDWRSEYYYLGQSITFETVNVTVSVEAIYERVENDDVAAFLAQSHR